MANIAVNGEVFKSNPILEGTFPKSLSPREMDLLTVLFTTINKDDKDVDTVRIHIKDLIKIYGLEHSNSAYERVFEVSERLLGRVIKIYNKENNTLTQHQLLSKSKYYLGEGYAEFKFHEELKPYLLDLQRYASYMLRFFLRLDSFYAKRLYELMVQYRFHAKNGEWYREFELDDLRGFLGIEKKQYKLYGHFKSRVVSIAVEQINERSDFNIRFEEIKKGRSVKALVFYATNKKEVPEELPPPPDPLKQEYKARLIAYGVTSNTAEELARDHANDVLAYNLGRMDRKAKSPTFHDDVPSPAGWLYNEIKANRGEQLSFLRTQQAEEKKAEQDEEKKANEESKRNKAYSSYKKSEIKKYIDGLSREVKNAFKKDFESFLAERKGKSSFIASRLESHGFFDTSVIIELVAFFEEHEILHFMTREEFDKAEG